MMLALPSLVTFGPLATWPTQDQIEHIREAFRNSPDILRPLIKAIDSLEFLWARLESQDNGLAKTSEETKRSSQFLRGLLTKGADEDDAHIYRRLNVVMAPLTIVIQILQYRGFLGLLGPHCTHDKVLENVKAGAGVQGFCAGLLTALAVASARTDEEVIQLAASSVQLAFCIGAYVDLDQARSEHASVALRMKPHTNLKEVEDLLSLRHTTAYIAAVRDVFDITVTAPVAAIADLLSTCSQYGIASIVTSVSGRYHSSVHENVPEKILRACLGTLDPRLGEQQSVRSNISGQVILQSDAVRVVLESILVHRAEWYETVSASVSNLHSSSSILSIGADALPQSISRAFPVTHLKEHFYPPKSYIPRSQEAERDHYMYPKDSIAVIGMAGKFPGADSIDDFWRVLSGGKSMLQQVPKDRFEAEEFPRSQAGLKFWGNFIDDIKSFDHKFFKKSAKEASSMDPQQRLLLEVTYQAMESSGYFGSTASTRPTDIGCYIGACSTDYDANVGCHPPTAYATTGTLRAFLSGRLSHYFGWSGPSLVFDTACSSSAVAIHTACTALLAGECSQAVAGGATLITSPYLYENLAAAHFLSPSGATKPFDAAADGYCRGEGVAVVVLKQLSQALADGDNVLGVIAGSGVNQNANCVSITVPHSSSQSALYHRTVTKSGINPKEVTFVEAHGTGTPVGDPIEMESIRQVFGGKRKNSSSPLFVSSVKGNIGHLEGASGVAALIKALLQMQYRTACVQASFKSLNPKILPLETDHICIPTSNLPLVGRPLTACINNYGAAGSNATMMLIEGPMKASPFVPTARQDDSQHYTPLSRFPIQITAASVTSLIRYCQALDSWVADVAQVRPKVVSPLLPSIAFSLAKQQNQDLGQVVTLKAPTEIQHLRSFLRAVADTPSLIKERAREKPLVLCFGGQVGQNVGLSRRFWDSSSLFRFHLDSCDEILRSLGYPSIYPAVFDTSRITDVVVLQSAIFATQYASSRAWIDSGLKVSGLVGHSLGQFAALCISGILSLRDGLRFVAGRASLMKTHWGSEPGTMIATEADSESLEELLAGLSKTSPSHTYETACYNGPTSQVIVSDAASADHLEAELKRRSIRHKRLNVTHGFHSRFVEPMMPHLENLASSLTLSEAIIPIETCTDKTSWLAISPTLLAGHTREPVFFGQAVQRLQGRLGTECTFLEVGSDSGVTAMARRALGPHASASSSHCFLPAELSKETSLESMVDTTVSLWDRGHRVQFWGFHRHQASEYDFLRLPPYQFDRPKHWLKLEPPVSAQSPEPVTLALTSQAPVLIRLIESNSQTQRFHVDQQSEEFQALVQGNLVKGEVQCPTSIYVELATRAALMLEGRGTRDDQLVSLQNLSIHVPLIHSTLTTTNLGLRKNSDCWKFEVTSIPSSARQSGQEAVLHATGSISVQDNPNDALHSELARYRRLAGPEKVKEIFNNVKSVLIRGSMIYRLTSPTVEYAGLYRNIRSMASHGNIVVGTVALPSETPQAVEDSFTRTYLIESFLQIATLHANTIHEPWRKSFFQVAAVERIQYGPEYRALQNASSADAVWDVVTCVSSEGQDLLYDIFVYNNMTDRLAMFLLGARLSSTGMTTPPLSLESVDSMAPSSARMASTKKMEGLTLSEVSDHITTFQQAASNQQQNNPAQSKGGSSIFDNICTILENVAEVPRSEIKGSAPFDELGVDSLMMIEVIGEISTFYKIELPIEELEQLTDLDSLVQYLHRRGCSNGGDEEVGAISSSTSSVGAPTAATSSVTPLPSTNGATPVTSVNPMATLSATDMLRGALPTAQTIFDSMRFDYEKYAEQAGFSNFWEKVYPDQARLVEAYTVQTFRELGCDLARLSTGEQMPPPKAPPKRHSLVKQMCRILVDAGVLTAGKDGTYIRTAKAIDSTPPSAHYENMLRRYPQHTSETILLNLSGSCLADCMTGKTDPLKLLFANRNNLALMGDVYDKAPMCQASTWLLADFLAQTMMTSPDKVYQIIEVGAGTGGTAKYLVNHLASKGVKFEYTFTDISPSLVGLAKKMFQGKPMVKFAALDCDQAPPPELRGKFDVVIATNCIHATKNATSAATNMASLLCPGGVISLVEFTRGLYWFDLVYGLLDGWWAFTDGRQHALADQWFWDKSLKAAGFQHVSWTDGSTEESRTMRVICGFKAPAEKEWYVPLPAEGNITKRAGLPTQTFVWKHEGNLELKADVYFPKTPDEPTKERPVALMIHGGGHLLFGRQDIPMKHVRTLLQRGFLPVSVDYRLCPELSLFDGPVTDCRDALRWVRETLPQLRLSGPRVQIKSGPVLALGWSSGGQLAMTLGYTARSIGVAPPDVILPFYSPSDLEAESWDKPAFPAAAEEEPVEIWGELDCVREEPILEYTPMSNKRATALSLTLKDDRARLILHMNWRAQSVPVLIRGLPHKNRVAAGDATNWKKLPPPPVEKVRECSPYWHILQGHYRTPTFMVHGNIDDWIPYQMTEKTIAALQQRGVPAGILIPDQCGHAFDLFPTQDRLGHGWLAINAAYDFACAQLGMEQDE